ncbi:MAG: hypothetical protein J7K40_06745 [candidate division Zixibacteria bacterium]|nr:hypothetical protein [candidate division Zixibacteria bacterium]
MDLIRFNYKNNGEDAGAVTIHIDIDGLMLWQYVYKADDKKFEGNYRDKKPHVHALGMPSELELDSNEWEVRLINSSDDSRDYKIKIVWRQDGNDLFVWEKSDTLIPAEPAKRLTGSALLAGK